MINFANMCRSAAVALGLWATAAGAAEPARPWLPIIVYHQVRNTPGGPPDSLEAISLERFEAQMRYLHEHGYVTLDAAEAVAFVRTGTAPAAKIVAIQFDDGWKSARLALPVLERYGFKATFWIIVGKGIGWPHMDWDEVQEIARNPRYEVESHTMTHPYKPGTTLVDWVDGRTLEKGEADARWELVESRRVLGEKIGHPVLYLAWPGGHYNAALIAMAEEAGYDALFTVDDGVNRQGDDLLQLKRTMIHGTCDDATFAQILHDGIYRDCGVDAAKPPG